MDLAHDQQSSTEAEVWPRPKSRSLLLERAGVVTLAQFLAAAGYVLWMAFGTAPAPLSLGGWAFAWAPPLVFGPLFIAGFRGRRTWSVLPQWQRIVLGLGCLVAGCGLVFTLALAPILTFGMFMDYAIG